MKFLFKGLNELTSETLKHTQHVNIFDDVAFNKETYSQLDELTLLRDECVKFYTKLVSSNISIVYRRRLKIIEFLNEISENCEDLNESTDDDDDDEDIYDDEMNDTFNLLFHSFELIE